MKERKVRFALFVALRWFPEYGLLGGFPLARDRVSRSGVMRRYYLLAQTALRLGSSLIRDSRECFDYGDCWFLVIVIATTTPRTLTTSTLRSLPRSLPGKKIPRRAKSCPQRQVKSSRTNQLARPGTVHLSRRHCRLSHHLHHLLCTRFRPQKCFSIDLVALALADSLSSPCHHDCVPAMAGLPVSTARGGQH